jgi:hypothetical protein
MSLSGSMVRHLHTHATVEGMPRAGFASWVRPAKAGQACAPARRTRLDCLAGISKAKAPGGPYPQKSVETTFSALLIAETAIGHKLPFPLTAWDVATAALFVR